MQVVPSPIPAMDSIRLHGFWVSPYTQRIVWALNLKGIKYEYFPEDLSNKSELLLDYNPVYKKVPVLVHNDKPIAESLIILEYIDEKWPQNPLLPADPHERAFVRHWAKFIDDKVTSIVLSANKVIMREPYGLQVRSMFAFFKLAGEEHEKAIADTMEVLRVIEEEGLAKNGKKFFGGDEIGIADIALGWIVDTFAALEEIVGVKMVKADAFPRLHQWAISFKGIPVIRDTLPPHAHTLAYFREKREFWMSN